MQAAFDYAVEYIHDRKQFGQPVAEFQLMQGAPRPLYLISIPMAYRQDRRYVHQNER